MPILLHIWLSILLPAWFGLGRGPDFSMPDATEICDNAIDDDKDGFIDLNDTDCECQIAEPESLIPNPSFEKQECCPQDRSMLNCAKDWIQASEATTDYLHTCGWMGWPNFPPPLPFPDGQGCVGFRNGRFGGQNANPNWKEYAGACLKSPLKAKTTYRFQFYIGFSNPNNSPPILVTFFGSRDCKNLPFGVGNAQFGCPTNGQGWEKLGEVFVSGNNQWVETGITVTPAADIYAIAIGPDCPIANSSVDLYYFFDNLILADLREFEFTITAAGNPCSSEYTLQIPPQQGFTYQWYKEGIALVGETQPSLKVKTGEGDYQVLVRDGASCKVTKPYAYRKPREASSISGVVCPGDQYNFNGAQLTRPGTYWDTLKTKANCDSIVQLTLLGGSDVADTVQARIFPGEVYQAAKERFSRPGKYRLNLTSSIGCDSMVLVDLQYYKVYAPTAFSPNGDGINDYFAILGGNELVRISSLQVFDRWGGLVYSEQGIITDEPSSGWNGKLSGRLAPPGIYAYVAHVVLDDGKERQMTGTVTLVR